MEAKFRKQIEFICANCGVKSLQRADHAARSPRNFCSRVCSAEHALKVKVARANTAKEAPHESVKECSTCGETKPLTEFHKGNYKYGRRPNCKVCRSKEQLDSKTTYRWRDFRLKKNYGIGIEDYEKMYSEQGGRCAICEHLEPVLAVDHDHRTGKVRQLLCGKCNAGIGMLKDSLDVVLSAAAYLEKHRAG